MSPRKRSGRVVRLVLFGGLGLWALALAVFFFTRPAAAHPGEQVLTAGLTGRRIAGGELALLPRDSMVAVLAATSECAACRLGLPSYHDLAVRLKGEGIAFRAIVASDSVAARQFSRLLPDPGTAVWDPEKKLFDSIGIRGVPSLYLVGRDGRLLKTWAPLPADPRVADEIARAARAAR